MSKKNYIDEFFKEINGGITSALEGAPGDVCGFVDTGSYILNALYSGSIFKGMPNNKINVLAGEEATGKSYISLEILKYFMKTHENGYVFIHETEGALTKEMLEERGMPVDRVKISQPETIQEFKMISLKFVNDYLKLPENKRFPCIMLLDSLGMLPTSKESNDVADGKEITDMTRTREIKSTFRVLTLKLSKAKIPFLVTNHVYQTMGLFPTKQMAGGSGIKYSANNIIALSKSKEKDSDGDVIGSVLRCKVLKSRLSKENSEGRLLLTYANGLDKYYGLLELGLQYNYFKQIGNKIELPDGKTVFRKQIIKNPETYFTKEVLEKLDTFAKIEFNYGPKEQMQSEDEEE